MMFEITVMTLAENAQISPNTVLVTRITGRRFLRELDAILTPMPLETITVLDFAGIEIMDASFADEVFSTWAARHTKHSSKQRFLLLRSLSSHLLENLSITLSSRPLREKGLRNCVLPYLVTDGVIDLVGKAEGHVHETFALLRDRRQMNTHELARLLGLELHAASVRLKVLHDLCLAIRREESPSFARRYVYIWPY